MPNWCHNKLAVTGEQDALIAFIEKVNAPDADGEGQNALSFAVHVPEPDNIDEFIPPADSFFGRIGELGWYPWRCIHWGAKWDASCNGVGSVMVAQGASMDNNRAAWIVIGDSATISFQTAWSPPGPWLKATAELEPDLSFILVWAEPGNNAAGRMTARGDAFVEEELEVDQVLSAEEMWF